MITFNTVLHFLLPRKLSIFDNLPIIGGLFDPGDPPPAPDFTGAAEATAAGNLEMARQALEANRYDILSPLGTQYWTKTPIGGGFDEAAYNQAMADYEASLQAPTQTAPNSMDPDLLEHLGVTPTTTTTALPMPTREQFTTEPEGYDWTKTIELSPEGQELFDKNIATQLGMADIGLLGLEQMQDIFSDPFRLDEFTPQEVDPFELDDFEGYREDVYDAMLDRLETDIQRDWDTRNAELYAGGIGRGTEAYEWEQTMRDRTLNDARLQAYIQATDQALRERERVVDEQLLQRQEALRDRDFSLDERRRAIQEALLQRQTPLNELSAFRTGSQVMMPSFEAQPGMPTISGPQYLTAAQEQAQYDLAGYNADVMAQNAMLSGLFGLGAGYLAGR